MASLPKLLEGNIDYSAGQNKPQQAEADLNFENFCFFSWNDDGNMTIFV